jgi:hypothetical protein
MQPLKLLPLGLVLLGACGSTPNATHPPGSNPQPSSDPQPFSQITQASSTTQAELGVVAWWSTITPDGVLNIGGMDASQSERVEFIADATSLKLRDPQGTFETDLDGDKVVSSTFGDAGAQHTLALMKADLAPSDAAPSAAVSAASVSAGELHPTDNSCPKGSLIEDCSSLFYGDCDKNRFQACMHDSGSLKAANFDFAQASAPGQLCYDGTLNPVPHPCAPVRDTIDKWTNNFHGWKGCEVDPISDSCDYCDHCATQWLSTPSQLLNCPDSAWDHNPNAYLFGWGVYNYCRPRIN